jgi:hypothetical protein
MLIESSNKEFLSIVVKNDFLSHALGTIIEDKSQSKNINY